MTRLSLVGIVLAGLPDHIFDVEFFAFTGVELSNPNLDLGPQLGE